MWVKVSLVKLVSHLNSRCMFYFYYITVWLHPYNLNKTTKWRRGLQHSCLSPHPPGNTADGFHWGTSYLVPASAAFNRRNNVFTVGADTTTEVFLQTQPLRAKYTSKCLFISYFLFKLMLYLTWRPQTRKHNLLKVSFYQLEIMPIVRSEQKELLGESQSSCPTVPHRTGSAIVCPDWHECCLGDALTRRLWTNSVRPCVNNNDNYEYLYSAPSLRSS